MRNHIKEIKADEKTFCKWLHDWLDRENAKRRPDDEPGLYDAFYCRFIKPAYLDVLKEPAPHLLNVLSETCFYYSLHASRSYDAFGNPQTREEPEPVKPRLALSVTITPIEDGINLDIKCDDTQGITLEEFDQVLDESFVTIHAEPTPVETKPTKPVSPVDASRPKTVADVQQVLRPKHPPVLVETPIEQHLAAIQLPKNTELSNREKEVFNLAIIEGMSRKEIAKKLMIGTSTIDTHVQSICEKLKLPEITKSLSDLRRFVSDG